MNLKEGSYLQNGKYRIESVLGQGGFGITYMALQLALNRRVAIKEFFMKEHCNRDEDSSHVSVPSHGSKDLVEKFKAKFIREAQTIATLNHPNIIRIHDIFEENGTAYYVMEYHGSGSLSSQNLPLPPEIVVAYAGQLSSALKYLHKRKIMHLDVKPANVLLNEDGNAVLIDFGISKHYDDFGYQTSSLPICFSRYYAPIEQNGMTPLTFSPSADIYALGATMYKILTGQTPPESSALLNNPSLLTFQKDVPEHLVFLIKKCMRPIVGERPQSIDEFSSLLGTPQSPQPPTPPIPPTPPTPPDDSTIVIKEEEFVAQYHRFVGTQKYKDAFELCLFNAKSLPAARKQLPEAAETYLKKCGGTVYLPAPSGASYDWLTDLLLSKRYKKMSALKNGLQVENVSIELVQSGGQNFVRLSRKMTFERSFANIGAFFSVLFLFVVSMQALIFLSDSYYGFDFDSGWESVPKYEQFLFSSPYEPDPTWLLITFGAWAIIALVIWNMWRRFRKPFKSICKILTDDIVNKFTK